MGTLRLLLALSVVVGHAGPLFGTMSLIGGPTSVEAFFIISGFYMTLILNEKYYGQGSYRLFITNRFLKIYPVFWAVLLITIIISLFSIKLHQNVGLEQFTNHFTELHASTFFYAVISNIVLFGQDASLFFQMVSGGVDFTHDFRASAVQVWKFMLIPPAWSLALELMFYLIAPFLVRRRLYTIIPIIVASFFLKVFILYGVGWNNDPWTYRFFPSELAYFLAGSVSYKLYQKLNTMKFARLQFNILGKFLLIFISLFVIFSQFLHIPGVIRSLGFCALITLAIPFIFNWTKRNSVDRMLGELSYPVYISHWLVISILSAIGLREFNSIFTLTVAVVSVIFSILLIKLIMNPIENYRQSRVKRDNTTFDYGQTNTTA